jgi:hypothetical protein
MFGPEFPREILIETSSPPVRLVRANGYYARIGDGNRAADCIQELQDDGSRVQICRGGVDPAETDPAGRSIVPVYRRGEHGPLSVPTGRVFLRLTEGSRIEQLRPDIERTGFRIEKVLDYAPHAGWVVPVSGRIGDALSGFSRLKEIRQVQAIEPQMLTPSTKRDR